MKKAASNATISGNHVEDKILCNQTIGNNSGDKFTQSGGINGNKFSTRGKDKKILPDSACEQTANILSILSRCQSFH